MFGLGIFLPALRIVPYLMLGGTLCVALSYMLRARIEPKFDTVPARLLVMFLAFAQPLVRGWNPATSPGCNSNALRAALFGTHEKMPAGASGTRKSARTRLLERGWEWIDIILLEVDLRSCSRKKAGATPTDTGWKEWDIQIYGNFWWSIILQTVTEYHGGGKCLTRVRLRSRFVTSTIIFSLVALSIVIYRQLHISHLDLWSVIPYSLFLIFLASRARALKARVGELVDLAGYRAGLQRVTRRGLTVSLAMPVQALEAMQTDPAART